MRQVVFGAALAPRLELEVLEAVFEPDLDAAPVFVPEGVPLLAGLFAAVFLGADLPDVAAVFPPVVLDFAGAVFFLAALPGCGTALNPIKAHRPAHAQPASFRIRMFTG